MGFYLLNISVDTVDPNPEYIPEDLSINDQESIVEIIVEQVLGYEDAFGEYDDHDTEDHNSSKTVKIELLAHQASTDGYTDQSLTKKRNRYPDYEARLTNGFREIEAPPPKV